MNRSHKRFLEWITKWIDEAYHWPLPCITYLIHTRLSSGFILFLYNFLYNDEVAWGPKSREVSDLQKFDKQPVLLDLSDEG